MYRLLKSEFEEVYKYRYVVYAFTSIKLKQRYRRSVFGYLWTVFTPIINFLIMGGVISVIARGSTVENYFFFFMSASVFFGYISNIINSTYNCLISNENFIKKIYFPKSIFIIEVVALEAINFFFTFATLLLPAVIFGFVTLKIDFFLTIFAFLLSVPLLLGIGIFVGIGAVFFRDLVHMIPAALQALYFLTPILYSPQMVPREYYDELFYKLWLIIWNFQLLFLFHFLYGIFIFKENGEPNCI